MYKPLPILIILLNACSSSIDQQYVIETHQTKIEEIMVSYDLQSGDTIGVFPVGYRNGQPGTPGDIAYPVNIPFIFDNNTWRPVNEDYLFTNEDILDIYAYYPYDSRIGYEEGMLRISEYSFDLSDQKKKIDLLWAKNTIDTGFENIVNLSFSHLFSKITIRLHLENLANEDVNISIHNIKTSATVDLATGIATANNISNVIIPVLTNDQTDVIREYEAIVPPQEIPAGTSLFYFSIGEQNTLYASNQSILLQQGTNQTFELTLITNTMLGL